jgi:hypothetical protein
MNPTEVYLKILEYFNTYTFYDDLLKTRSYVSMDNIHDALLIVGLTMEEPIQYYIIKAKQLAINEYTQINNRYNILMNNALKFLDLGNIEFEKLCEYGFNNEELDLILELLAGTRAYNSIFTRRKREHILTNVRRKIIGGSN